MTLAERYTDTKSLEFGAGYTLTNEDPYIVRRIMRRIAPSRVLSILGGGEQAILGPVALGIETVGVDCEYRSAIAALMKGTLVERHGPRVKRIIGRGERYFWDAAKEVFQDFPESLRREYDVHAQIENGMNWRFRDFVHLWCYLPDALLEKAQRNMGKLSVVRSDIKLVEGRFDAVYLSNAFGYHLSTFELDSYHRDAERDKIKRLLNPKGHLIITTKNNRSNPEDRELSQVKRDMDAGKWIYQTLQLGKAA